MNIIVCDGGCGAQSPDPTTRLHVANHWATVRVAGPREDIDRCYEGNDKRFCEKCWPRVEVALKPVKADQ